MPRLLPALLAAALLTAAPAWGFDGGRTQLSPGQEPGRLDLGRGGALALGPAVEPVPEGFTLIPGGQGRKALGGFLATDVGKLRLSGQVTGADDGLRAQVAAAYAFGDTSLVMRLGSEWAAATTLDDAAYRDGLDLSVSVQHALTSGLYVAGTAAATTATDGDGHAERGSVLFGASIGVRF